MKKKKLSRTATPRPLALGILVASMATTASGIIGM